MLAGQRDDSTRNKKRTPGECTPGEYTAVVACLSGVHHARRRHTAIGNATFVYNCTQQQQRLQGCLRAKHALPIVKDAGSKRRATAFACCEPGSQTPSCPEVHRALGTLRELAAYGTTIGIFDILSTVPFVVVIILSEAPVSHAHSSSQCP